MKFAIISGASKGIGKAIALKFAKQGYDVAITTYKDQKNLYKVQKEIIDLGVSCIAEICDMSDYNSCKLFFEEITKKYKNIDVLINNAGISYFGLLQDMSYEAWDKLIKNNLYSVFNCSKFCIPFMIKQKYGNIINISSIWGNVGASMEVAYSTSKGAINAFTKSLAKELAPNNIQVNAIAAGLIDTNMNNILSEEELYSLISDIPASRIGKADEVADLAFFLAQKNSYINAQIITIDGAWT